MSTLRAGTLTALGRVRAWDRVWLAVVALVVATALVSPAQALETLRFAGLNLVLVGPYIVVATALMAAARASWADVLLGRAFVGRTGIMIILAALVGTVSPLCGVQVLPLVAALLAMGVPLSAVMAFWVSSPVTDPPMYAVTVGVLGASFANAKTLAALVLGLAGGFATLGLQGMGVFGAPLKGALATGAGCAPPAIDRAAAPAWRFWRSTDGRATFRHEALGAANLVTKWLAMAFLLESLMLAAVPAEALASLLGEASAWAIPFAVAVGVPAYVHGYAALPLMGGLMEMGVAPGAALAFMLAGAITSLPAAIAVFALVRAPVFAWYLFQAVAGSLVAGYAYALFLAL